MSDDCLTCPHPFHGLPCRRHIYPDVRHPYTPGQCTCDGPFGTSQEEETTA